MGDVNKEKQKHFWAEMKAQEKDCHKSFTLPKHLNAKESPIEEKQMANHAKKLEDRTTSKKPRLLVVDDMERVLPDFAQTYEGLGFEVVKMHLHVGGATMDRDPTIIRCTTLPDIIKYAMNPANRIDAVLTDRHGPDHIRAYHWYGYDLADKLAEAHFNGPVAIHSGQLPEPMTYNQSIGVFNKLNAQDIADKLYAALQAKGITK